tara:strand:- start:517 stop:1017 length:501 start_codon:yes stop_codon:yes gene_type:complete
MYPFGKSKKKNTLPIIGLAAGIVYFMLKGSGSDESAPKEKISALIFTYYSKTTNEVVEANVSNGATYNGTAMGIRLTFTDASPQGSAIRVNYKSSKDGAFAHAGDTRTFVLSPGETRTYDIEPSEYGGTYMGADTVAFVVEVLPPQTGGVPTEGETYPTYRFEYRL